MLRLVSLDAAAAGAAQTQFVSAVQTEMDALPEICYAVPFGSLTNNSLLSGLGPGWLLSIQPKGYVQGEIRETTQSLSINTTRYSAVLQLSVTVNMILDGSLCLRFGLNLPPQMWYTKLIPTNGV